MDAQWDSTVRSTSEGDPSAGIEQTDTETHRERGGGEQMINSDFVTYSPVRHIWITDVVNFVYK